MKALDYLYTMKQANEDMGTEPISIYEAIKELEDLQKEKDFLEKYYWFSKKKRKRIILKLISQAYMTCQTHRR